LGGILYEDDLVSAHHYYQDEEPNYLVQPRGSNAGGEGMIE